ncbi:MAG: hypothetical protein JWM11_4234 [Planctomycetaceae bacterium]|nr:hypothetical protein [Planctomycetaceae bacterium]
MITARILNVSLIASLTIVMGCAEKPDPQRFVPKTEIARNALESVLDSWVKGDPVGLIPNTSSPQVHITDSSRKKGQKLKSFRILGEVPGDAPRCFAVKLSFTNPVAEERARYAVMGIDPLWVFRHEDLEMLAHWSHPMDEKKTTATEKSEKQPATASDNVTP